MSKKRDSFSGTLGFILAAAGSAVGLGNIWRFPYLAAKDGGGIFLLTYLILTITFGFTLLVSEVVIGRKTKQSALTAYGEISKKFKWLGTLATIVPFIILPYYCVIGGWVTKWLAESVTGNLSLLADNGGSYWQDFVTGWTDSGFYGPTLWFIIFAVLCILCIVAGVRNGIEKLSTFLMPALLVMIIGIMCYEMIAVEDIWDGVVFYLNPDINKLTPDTFLGAVSQVFYSMSLACGTLITFGS
jgi:NSS family neurotransmitter:Na+ symporter